MSTLSSRARQALREADEAGEAVERDLFERQGKVERSVQELGAVVAIELLFA